MKTRSDKFDVREITSLELALEFHKRYERLAPQLGYETKKSTRKFDLNSANGKLMIAVCKELIESLPLVVLFQRLDHSNMSEWLDGYVEGSNTQIAISQGKVWKEVAELAHVFLDSLPRGWLAGTSGDVGALNEFYIKYRNASNLNSQQWNTAQP